MNVFNSLIISKDGEPLKLKPESEDDYIEYKLRLDTKTKFGIDRLISQMNYRFDVGKATIKKKEAHYILGICDNGTLGGLSENEIDETFSIFTKAVVTNKAVITHFDKKQYDSSYIIYAIVQKIETFKIKELNVAFVGPSQHGKTTTIAHLAYGQKENGSGYGRKLIFKHVHEKNSGTTSSVKNEIVGLKSGMLINYNVGVDNGWEDIVDMSDKIINIIDLPGNLKYCRSTFFGLSTYDIDAIIMVSDPLKMNDQNKIECDFYLEYAKNFNIPYKVLTIDNTENETSSHPNEILFSNITGKGLSCLVNFLNTISKHPIYEKYQNLDPLFCISETFCVPDVGIIFAGTMKMGSLSIGNVVYLTDGTTYFRTKVKSIQRKQIDSKTLYTGENGAIQLDFGEFITPEVSKHMIITTNQYLTYNNFKFKMLYNTTELTTGQQCLMFVDNMISNVFVNISEQNIITLKSTTNIIIPTINTNNCIAFLKYDSGISFGLLEIS